MLKAHHYRFLTYIVLTALLVMLTIVLYSARPAQASSAPAALQDSAQQ